MSMHDTPPVLAAPGFVGVASLVHGAIAQRIAGEAMRAVPMPPFSRQEVERCNAGS